MNADLMAMKLHMDDRGVVWTLFSDGPPRDTGQTIVPFMLSSAARFPKIRLIGCHRHAQLILNLQRRFDEAGEGVVEVCSPSACRTEAAREDPRQVLLALRQFERTASTGGWHPVRRHDMITYAMISQLQKIGYVDDHLRRLLYTHIAWPALSFVPHLNPDSCAVLLAEVIDPRWFVDLRHPARGSRLRAYLGLDLKTLQGVLGTGPRRRLHERCEVVVDAWRQPIDPKMIERPDNFLYRVVRHHAEKGDEEKGVLRASQKFVEYLRLVWLAGLGSGRHQLEALFAPEHFFHEKYETRYFLDHLKKVIKA